MNSSVADEGVSYGQSLLMKWTPSNTVNVANYEADKNTKALRLHMLSRLADTVSYEIDTVSQKARKLSDIPWHTQLKEAGRLTSLRSKLGGCSHVKTWGLDVNDSRTAVCMTIHTSDMIEFVTTVQEQCSIAFGATATPLRPSASRIVPSPQDVRKHVLEWTCRASRHSSNTIALDGIIRKVAAGFVAQFDPTVYDVSEDVDFTMPTMDAPEKCQICDTVISPEDLTGASCQTGHQFSKSNIF